MLLSTLLAREQRAFLSRSRKGWGSHLDKARAFFGEALMRAEPGRSILILGAGSGLEIPWEMAPTQCTGWDADPWSRVRTCLRHHRWPPWVFEDLTGGLAELETTVRRCLQVPGSGRPRPLDRIAHRLAGLLPSLNPQPQVLRDWLQEHEPGVILVANILGQIGVVAQSLVERMLGPGVWDAGDGGDALTLALDGWIRRALEAMVAALQQGGAELWMLHDRAVIWDQVELELGALEPSWTAQLQAAGASHVHDPLCGVDLLDLLKPRQPERFERWLWPVGPEQLHMMEALAYSS